LLGFQGSVKRSTLDCALRRSFPPRRPSSPSGGEVLGGVSRTTPSGLARHPSLKRRGSP
jgi:hypothetical protein